MVMATSTYRARWIMELSTFNSSGPPGPGLLGPVRGVLVARLLPAVPTTAVRVEAGVVTSLPARRQRQQSRSTNRSSIREQLIPNLQNRALLTRINTTGASAVTSRT